MINRIMRNRSCNEKESHRQKLKTTKWQIHVEIECLTINIFKKKIDIETFLNRYLLNMETTFNP